MQIKLKFLGAARNVTGSKYLIEANGTRLLVDCGLYQEREFKSRNWEPIPVEPGTIDAVILTHAHIDHCGLLPKLAKDGFTGKVYSTEATCEITEIMLMDSAKLQQEDAEFKKKRHQKEGRQGRYPEIPLYTVDNAKSVLSLLNGRQYDEVINIGDGIELSFHDAGHVLGAAMVKLVIRQDNEERTIIFSGDIGTRNKPILRDRTTFEKADYVVVESTYGDRLHQKSEDIGDALAEVINSTHKSRGNKLSPALPWSGPRRSCII